MQNSLRNSRAWYVFRCLIKFQATLFVYEKSFTDLDIKYMQSINKQKDDYSSQLVGCGSEQSNRENYYEMS